jgi:phosphatidylserine/phosphatidylglycerophosphate/cardiolipin synthase-like enzyme
MATTPQLLALKAYAGDCKTMLAFDLPKAQTARLAGFTIYCKPAGAAGYYLFNTLQFEHPDQHAQDAAEPAYSSVNAPFHKFRWLHVPGSFHQGLTPYYGAYTYTVTPRYFDDGGHLKALDQSLSKQVSINVGPFDKPGFQLGFTRGYTQSQAFVHRFGQDAMIQPAARKLLFDTAQQAGVAPNGKPYSFAEAYQWLGFSARALILGFLDEVIQDPQQYLQVFAYDLNEPDVCKRLLTLAGQGRLRMILDNSDTHHSPAGSDSEDQFEARFQQVQAGAAEIKRGDMGRYAHNKVFVSFNQDRCLKVLTGSTNFSVTGMYVNSNHVMVFDDSQVAAQYGAVFEAVWASEVKAPAFRSSALSREVFIGPASVPATSITFAPHDKNGVTTVLGVIVDRINQEQTRPAPSVLFAVMEMDTGKSPSPVYLALKALHKKQDLFSYGISDNPDDISLYEPDQPDGVIVTGKPGATVLPPPFDKVKNVVGIGHQIHHKFIVCGFTRPDAVVYCGSSNLAPGGEQNNGDNLLAIADQEVAVAFAMEALGLVDHFQFMDRMASKPQGLTTLVKTKGSKQQAARQVGWFLSTTDAWTQPYYNPADARSRDRTLFG